MKGGQGEGREEVRRRGDGEGRKGGKEDVNRGEEE